MLYDMVQMILRIKQIKKYSSTLYQTGPTDDTGMAKGGTWPQTFCLAKIKKGSKGKKAKSFKAETIKRLSPRSKCYCFSNVYCFILERLEFKSFSVFHDPSTLNSISPVQPNLALICAALHRKFISLRCLLGGIFSYFLLLLMTQFFSQFFFYLFET